MVVAAADVTDAAELLFSMRDANNNVHVDDGGGRFQYYDRKKSYSRGSRTPRKSYFYHPEVSNPYSRARPKNLKKPKKLRLDYIDDYRTPTARKLVSSFKYDK
eukprot:1357385-Amorphochlora_amoeboformis.AAC.1